MYITSADVSAYLGRTLSAEETTQVNAIIPGLEVLANTYMNRSFAIGTAVTEYFDGGVDTFFVKLPPIDTLTHVKVDGSELDSSAFFLYASHIKTQGRTPVGNQNVEIKYTPLDGCPLDIKLALAQWASDKMLGAATSSGVKSVTVGPASITYADTEESTKEGTGIPDFVRTVLKLYRLEPLGV